MIVNSGIHANARVVKVVCKEERNKKCFNNRQIHPFSLSMVFLFIIHRATGDEEVRKIKKKEAEKLLDEKKPK